MKLMMPICESHWGQVPARVAGACALAAVLTLSACGGGGGAPSPAPNQAPTAVAKLSGEAVLAAVTTFDTSGTTDADGSIATRSWNYGDGQSGSADSHSYTRAGSYTATLTVTDNLGATASASVPVTVTKCSAAGTAAALLSPQPTLCVQTSRGEMVFEVFPVQAPITVANFLKYVDDGFYAGTLFHRVIAGFVAQAGGFIAGPTAKAATYAPIVLESNNGLKNWQYTLAMARTSVPDSATSQFYINLLDNHGLDYSASVAGANGYAVFGQVISGTALVDALGTVATGTAAGMTDVPVQDITIRSMVRLP